MRTVLWLLVVGLACVGGAEAQEAHQALLESYSAAQAAFLREDFPQVVKLVKPVADGFSPQLAAALRVPSETADAVQLWLWYALSLERLQRSADALRALDGLKTALAALPADPMLQRTIDEVWPEVLFWEGEVSRRASKLGRAKLAYERLLEQFPASSWAPKAHLGMGVLLFQEGAYEAAHQAVHSLAESQPPTSLSQQARLLEGTCAERLGKFSDAARLLKPLVDQPLEPTIRAQALVALGEAWDGLGETSAAIQAYTDAQQEPSASSNAAAFGLGWLYFRHHRCQDSLAAFEAYHPPSTADAEAHEKALMIQFATGRCAMEQGEDAAAVRTFEALRADDPESQLAGDAALSLAELYERQERFADAVEMVQTVLRQTFEASQQAQATIRWGSILLTQGDVAAAASKFQEALRLTSNVELRQAALNGWGDVEASLAHAPEAMAHYEAARQLDPDSRSGRYAAYQAGRLQLQDGNVDAALKQFQQVIDGRDQELAGEARLASVFARITTGDIDQAMLELDGFTALDLLPQQASRAAYYRALIAAQAGDTEEAKTLCSRVIAAAPSSEEALEALFMRLDLSTADLSPDEALGVLDRAWADSQALPRRHRTRLARRLGDMAYHLGQPRRAIDWYEAAAQGAPLSRSELDYRIASCYEEAGDIRLALERYQAIAQPPWRIRGQLAAARLLEHEERWGDARRLYRSLAEQNVPEAKIAQERLMELRDAHPSESP